MRTTRTGDHVRLTHRDTLRFVNERLKKGHPVYLDFAAQMTRSCVLIVPIAAVEFVGREPPHQPSAFISVEGRGAYRFAFHGRLSVGYLGGKLSVENDCDATNLTCLFNALFADDVDKYMSNITLSDDYVDTTRTPTHYP